MFRPSATDVPTLYHCRLYRNYIGRGRGRYWEVDMGPSSIDHTFYYLADALKYVLMVHKSYVGLFMMGRPRHIVKNTYMSTCIRLLNTLPNNFGKSKQL